MYGGANASGAKKNHSPMKLNEVIEKLGLETLTPPRDGACEVRGGYVCDLLSDVMGHAEKDTVWITMQVHRNVVAVASLKEVAAVVLVNGAQPDEQTLAEAREEGVALLSTPIPAFEAAGRLYRLLE